MSKISYEKQMHDRAKNEGKVLVTVDLNAKAIKKGAFSIQGAFFEKDIEKVKEAFTSLLKIMSKESDDEEPIPSSSPTLIVHREGEEK